MKTYIVHFSDARNIDSRAMIEVADGTTLSRATQMALEDFELRHGEEFEFPVFIDIHDAHEFADLDWMHQSQRD